jgi:chloramphenicol-sensitive protein RarD
MARVLSGTSHATTALVLPIRERTGLVAAVAAYGWWGVVPIYFRALRHVAPLEIVAHRVVWSVAVLAAFLAVQRRLRDLGPLLYTRRTLGLLVASTLLIAGNWLVFIWAIAHEQLLQASLGYFINPLVSVLLGAAVLGERLTRGERIAVCLAACGVAWLTFAAGVFPWIALFLAVSFALYGLVRKLANVRATEGLTVETMLLLPFAAGYLAMLAVTGRGALTHGSATTVTMLLAAGVITALPLVWFATAVQRLRLVTMGLLQYIAPTLQFLLAVVVFGEPFGRTHLIAFAWIWGALAVFTADNLRRALRSPAQVGVAAQ